MKPLRKQQKMYTSPSSLQVMQNAKKLLMKIKSAIDLCKQKGVVYSIPCECGKEYVGEIGRTLSQRMTEHKKAVRNNDPINVLAVHVRRRTTKSSGKKPMYSPERNTGPRGRLKKA